MDGVLLAGRIVFALVFIVSGFGHFIGFRATTGYARSKGVPLASVAVLVSGALFLLGGLSVATGVYGDIGALLIAGTLVPTALIMHGPWRVSDPQEKQQAQVQFFKDLSLAGAALLVFALFVTFEPGYAATEALLSF